MVRGAGTVLNVATVLAGSGVGMLLGERLPARTRDVVTDALGLVTLLVAALSAAAVLDEPLRQAVGAGAVLVVLGSVLVGGVAGSLLRIEARLESVGGRLQRVAQRRGAARTSAPAARAAGATAGEPAGRTAGRTAGETAGRTAGETAGEAAGPAATSPDADGGRERFVQGFLTASLVFCVGPLTILGSLSDGLGRGIEQLTLKATIDGFAAIAFASTFGIGVAAAALTVGVVQGSLTVLGAVLGNVLPAASISALTATGGLLLVGTAFRLLRIRQVPVGDLLPALLVAPLLTQLVAVLR